MYTSGSLLSWDPSVPTDMGTPCHLQNHTPSPPSHVPTVSHNQTRGRSLGIHSKSEVVAGVHEEVKGTAGWFTANSISVHIHIRWLYQSPPASIVEGDEGSDRTVGLTRVCANVLVGNHCTIDTFNLIEQPMCPLIDRSHMTYHLQVTQ